MTRSPFDSELLRRALATDRSALAPVEGLRPALGLVLPLAIGVATGHAESGAAVATGALVAGTAATSGAFEPPVLMVLLTGVVVGLSTFVGSATGSRLWLHVLVVVLWSFAAGMTVALGRVPSVVALQAAVALLAFGRFPLPPAGAAKAGLLVAAGGLIQSFLALTLRAPGRFRGERRAVAATFLALADYAEGIPGGATSMPVATAAAAAEDVLSRSWAEPGSAARQNFRSLLIAAGRMRVDLAALHDAHIGAADPAPVDAWLRQAAATLRALADGVLAGAVVEVPLAALPATGAPVEQLDPAWAWLAHSRTDAITGQLRAVGRLAGDLADARHGPLHVPDDLTASVRLLRGALGLRSPTFRHALRLAVVVPVALAVGHLLADRRGYWVPLTALILLKPDFASTASRGLARFLGTAAGVVLASLIADGLHPHGSARLLLVAVMAVLAWVGYSSLQANYSLFSAAIAALVVFLISIAAPGTVGVALDRLIDTALGAALAVLAYLLWPTWEGPRLEIRLLDLFDAERAYLAAVLGGLAGRPVSGAGLRRLADACRLARADADASLSLVSAEPRRVRASRVSPATAREMLAGARLLVRAGHTLAAVGDSRETLPELPGAAAFAAVLDRAFEQLRAPTFPALREAHDAFLAVAGESRLAVVVGRETDIVVDALDGIRASLLSAAADRPAGLSAAGGRA